MRLYRWAVIKYSVLIAEIWTQTHTDKRCYEGKAPTPVFLPGEPPWTGEPSELQSTGSQRIRHD